MPDVQLACRLVTKTAGRPIFVPDVQLACHDQFGTSVSAVTGTMPDVAFSLILAGIIIASAIVDVAARRPTLVLRP